MKNDLLKNHNNYRLLRVGETIPKHSLQVNVLFDMDKAPASIAIESGMSVGTRYTQDDFDYGVVIFVKKN